MKEIIDGVDDPLVESVELRSDVAAAVYCLRETGGAILDIRGPQFILLSPLFLKKFPARLNNIDFSSIAAS